MYFLGLVNELIQRVASKSCPHYFIPEMNMFENIPDEFLMTVGQKLTIIRRNPTVEVGRYTPPITRDDTMELYEKMADDSEEYKMALEMLLKIKFGVVLPGKSNSQAYVTTD